MIFTNCYRKLLPFIGGLFFVLFSPIILFAQKENYEIRHYTSANGLPQNSVLNIQFDKNGYCWMATEAGLVRFDNKNFNIYGTDNIPHLIDERIHELKLDTLGNVFAKNRHGQTISTKARSKNWSPRPFLYKGEDPNYYPTAGYLNSNPLIGVVWDSLLKTTNTPAIRTHFYLKNNSTYLIYKNDIYSIEKHDYKLLKHWKTAPSITVPVQNYIIQIWTNNHQVAIWYENHLVSEAKFTGDIIKNSNACFWCPTGTFLFDKGSLFRLDIIKGKVSLQKVLANLPIDIITCVYYLPKEDTYFIGTPSDGLFIVKKSDFQTLQVPRLLGGGNYYAVAKDSFDRIITSSVVFPKGEKTFNFSRFNDPYFFYVGAQNNVYFQANYNLYRFNFVQKTAVKLLSLDEKIANILVDSFRHQLIVVTAKSITGLSKKGEEVWTKPLPLNYPQEGVIRFFTLKDGKHILLTDNGLKWYDFDKNKIIKSILDSIRLRFAYQDNKGRLWISSDGSGAFMYQKEKLYNLPLGIHKQFKTIHAFIDDGKGYFWLPTNNGLYKVSIDLLADYLTHKAQDIYFYCYNTYNGLPTNEFNGGGFPSFQWLSDSSLVLPSMAGLIKFYPKSINLNYPNRPISIDNIIIDSVNLGVKNISSIIKLQPKFEQLIIEASCPYFDNPTNLQLEYAISGNTDKLYWQKFPDNGRLIINTLSSGEYKIIIRKTGISLEQRNASIILKIKVLTPFYNTWYFFTLIIGLVGLVVYLLFKRRISNLRKEKLKIEKVVLKRTLEIRKKSEQLKSSEIALKNSNQVKEQIIAMILHDLRSPIRFLKTITSSSINQYKDEIPASLLEILNNLHNSTNTIWEFLDRFFSWVELQQDSYIINKSDFLLKDVFGFIYSLYGDIVKLNGNELTLSSTDIQLCSDKEILLLVLRNLVDNANKNTLNGIINISAKEDENYVSIFVKDSGNGIKLEDTEFFKKSEIKIVKSGFGSQIILNMLQKINGELDFKTSSEGTIFIIKIPF